ncbi:MFS transporter [Bradyrhizobium jicamae]|uniref:MFS transporter n=1 Tax=Bradyrhizobium jicamae TaxID=280332 RepID=UPI001BAB1D90|nr:MFS transporter [Bradyrhizobium jicamae]MBR0752636.1 MFS transporter [Bradyrhizobium jicamae]
MTSISTQTTTSSGASLIGLLYAARALRGFGDGFAIIILPAYMTALGYDAVAVGIVATASLLGTAALTLLIGWIAPRFDLRMLLLFGAGLMIATGIAFPNVEHLTLIALVGFIGTVNPSGGDLGVAVPLEHAVLARTASDARRTQVFARYSLIGALCAAAGSLAASLPDIMVSAGATQLGAFRAMFYAYAALGMICALLYRQVPHAHAEARAGQVALGPSKRTVYKLAALFSVDAFAGGFVAQSLLVLWLFQRFDLSLSAAGLFFFWSSTLSAFSYPVAAWIAKRIGLVNTMVFTHIPSSIFLILAALSPNLYLALGLLLLRAALSQMDVPTRTSYVMAVVTPPERPAAAGVTAVPRSLASAISPAIAGVLLTTAFPGLPLIICGALKIGYDLALLVSFRHIKPPEEAG